MGSGGSLNTGICEYIEEQFSRVAKNSYLTISEMLEIVPHEDYPFTFNHLGSAWRTQMRCKQGILFISDRDHDGIFTIQDLHYLASWIQINLVSIAMYEFKSELQARSVSKLIEKLEESGGEEFVVQWFIRMLGRGLGSKMAGYLRIECVKIMYEILNVKIMADMDIQSFFYLVKKSSEELGHQIKEMVENDEEEEYIHQSVCAIFMSEYLKGICRVLKDVSYSAN